MFLLVIEGDESFDNFDSSEAVIYKKQPRKKKV